MTTPGRHRTRNLREPPGKDPSERPAWGSTGEVGPDKVHSRQTATPRPQASGDSLSPSLLPQVISWVHNPWTLRHGFPLLNPTFPAPHQTLYTATAQK